ncbi:importin 13 [Ceratocystis lukuohia]|uniref:Importin 13 n=1 Tax=Ceratocystis lukuohia TaxID=2019550 RepID=A0ABR4MFV6_9PEZI
MAAVKYPTSLEEVEALVLTLYDPGSVSNVANIQHILHQVQKSSEGWRIAHELLGRRDEKVRFFGVLTFIVKLNTESASLGLAEAAELRDTLLQWLVVYARDNSSKLVLRKLSTALVTCYLRFPRSWDRSVQHVLRTLSMGDGEASGSIAGNALASSQTFAVAILFASDLAEEAAKVDANSMSNLDLFNCIQDNVADVCEMVSHCIQLHLENPSGNCDVAGAAIHCLQAWISLSQKSLAKANDNSAKFKPLVLDIIEMMSSTQQIHTHALELLHDLLSWNTELLTPKHFDAIYTLILEPLGQSLYSRLLRGDFEFDCMQYGLVVIALGDSQMSSLVTVPGPREAQLLDILIGLISTQGYPGVDDKLFVPVIEFWCNFAETVAEECVSEEDEPGMGLKYLARVAQTVCNKIVLPPPDELTDWDTSEKDAFISARRDVSDFLEAAHSSLGNQLLLYYGQLMLEKLELRQWQELEGVAYSLGAFSYSLARNTSTDAIISSVFSEDLFSLLHPSNSLMPPRCRQTCIGLIEKFSCFFQRNVDRLPSALTVLFSVVGDASLTNPAVKSIYELCTSCRVVLMPEAAGFIEQYRSMISDNVVECITRERLAGAIASVIHIVPDENTRFGYLSQMLDIIETDVKLSLELASNLELLQIPNVTRCSSRCCAGLEPGELAAHVAVRVLRSLLCIARDLRSAVDYTRQDYDSMIVSPALSTIQSRLMETIAGIQRSFPSNGEITDVICHILRVGIAESIPGPFVFPVEGVAEYLVAQSASDPRIGAFIATACSLASSLEHRQIRDQDAILTRLTNWVIILLSQLPEIEFDVEVAHNALNFAEKAVLSMERTLLLLQSQPSANLETLFGFSLRAVDGKEPLAKTASLDFWATFLGHPIPLDPENPYRKAVEKLGPNIAECLMRNIGGNAARSELDRLSLPIKRMVATKPQAKMWLEAALMNPSFPSSKVSEEDKSQFLKKILLTPRSSRAANQVIRDFWLACRGSQFAYVS